MCPEVNVGQNFCAGFKSLPPHDLNRRVGEVIPFPAGRIEVFKNLGQSSEPLSARRQPNRRTPNLDFSSSTFGRIGGTGAMYMLQLAAKHEFSFAAGARF